MIGYGHGVSLLGPGAHRVDRLAGGGTVDGNPPTLAADLMLIMLDGSSGRLRVDRQTVSYALAGALLVELWLTGRITLERCRVVSVPDRPLPTDDLLRRTLGWLLTEPDHAEVGPWIEALASSALDLVAEQLERSGWIRRVDRHLSAAGVIYEPVDRLRVVWRSDRLVSVLAGDPQWPDLLLFVLVDAAGFTSRLLRTSGRPPSRDRLVALYEGVLRSYPSVVELMSVVSGIVDRTVAAS